MQPLYSYRPRSVVDSGGYEQRFLELMRERQIERPIDRSLIDCACLLCSEEKPHHCHRRLVAEYLQRHWGELEIEHLPLCRDCRSWGSSRKTSASIHDVEVLGRGFRRVPCRVSSHRQRPQDLAEHGRRTKNRNHRNCQNWKKLTGFGKGRQKSATPSERFPVSQPAFARAARELRLGKRVSVSCSPRLFRELIDTRRLSRRSAKRVGGPLDRPHSCTGFPSNSGAAVAVWSRTWIQTGTCPRSASASSMCFAANLILTGGTSASQATSTNGSNGTTMGRAARPSTIGRGRSMC
jgi:hypothetical protein